MYKSKVAISIRYYKHAYMLIRTTCLHVYTYQIICMNLFLQNHHLKSNNIAFSKVFCLGFSVPEIKLFLLFCYYMLTMLIYFITVVAHLLATDTLTASTNKYLVCSAGGDREQCEEHRERAEASLIGAISLTMLIVILYSLVNLSHLVYVIHFPTVKKTIQRLYKS